MHSVHVLNCGTVSGPEMLVVPALANVPELIEVWSLDEARIQSKSGRLVDLMSRYRLPHRHFLVKSRFDIRAVMNLVQQLRRIPRPAIVHTHDVKASLYLWLARILCSPRGLWFVATHHGALARADRLSRLYEKIFVFSAKYLAHRILCVSKSEYAILRKRGIPRTRLSLHRNGIDRPVLNWPLRRSTSANEVIRFAMVARLSAEKNHARALSVLRIFDEAFSTSWTLDLLGEGPEHENLRRIADEFGLKEKVHWQGFVSDAWKQMDQFDCLLSFSIGEGLPIVLLEAGYRMTPVFASDVGGVAEVCGAEGAVLFSLSESDHQIAQKLFNFLQNKERLRSCAEHLQDRVVRFYTEKRWRDELKKIYQSVSGCSV